MRTTPPESRTLNIHKFLMVLESVIINEHHTKSFEVGIEYFFKICCSKI